MSFSIKSISYSYQSQGGTPDDPADFKGIEIDHLEISKTGITAIIGPSGSGKTTLLSILAGFISPQIGPGGHLKFGAQAMKRGGHPAGRVSFVFQSSLLLGAASGLANILQGYVAAGKGTAKADTEGLTTTGLRKLLRMLGLADPSKLLLSKRARELSGGEAQRIAILRALLTDPDAVLCDEPTSSLDEGNAKSAMEALKEWSDQRQKPVIWVTHNIEQAAQYADHFIFVAGGKIVHPPALITELIAEDTGIERTAVLRDFAADLSKAQPQGSTPSDSAAEPVRISRPRYGRWVVNALSTDSPAAAWFDNPEKMPFAPNALRSLMGKVYPNAIKAQSWIGRYVKQAISYSRYGLSIILTILFAQIFSAQFFGTVAENFSKSRLDDPSVARVVFEHVIGQRTMGQSADAVELYAGDTDDSSIFVLENKLRAAMSDAGSNAQDLERVQIFGRRSISGSQLRFEGANQRCQGWQPVETVALDVNDPLVLQTKLAPLEHPAIGSAMMADINAATARSFTARQSLSADRIAFLDLPLVQLIRERCDIPTGGPLIAQWAAGPAGTLEPITLEIAGAIAQAPPLYPSSIQMIVYEHDFQDAANLQDGDPIASFRIASAYFPIDRFGQAQEVIQQAGYRVRDDSSAAVQQLLDVSRAARNVPPWIIWMNLIACLVVIVIVVDALVDLNKRVLAIFVAHGFRLRDMLGIMLGHLAPAFVAAIILSGGAIAVLWYFYAGMLPSDIGALSSLRNAAFLSSALNLLGAVVGAATFVILLWWRLIRKNLKSYLQE